MEPRKWHHNFIHPDPLQRPREIREWVKVFTAIGLAVIVAVTALAIKSTYTPERIKRVDDTLTAINNTATHAEKTSANVETLTGKMAADIPAAVEGATGIETGLQETINSVNGQIPATGQQLRANLLSVQGVTDDGRKELFGSDGLVPGLTTSLTSPGQRVWPGIVVNAGLIPTATMFVRALTKTAATFGVSAADLDSAITELAGEAGRDLDDVHRKMTDPRWDTLMTGLVADQGHIEAVLASFEGAAKYAPQIAELWTKMMRASSRWQKALYAARIVSLFFPLIP